MRGAAIVLISVLLAIAVGVAVESTGPAPTYGSGRSKMPAPLAAAIRRTEGVRSLRLTSTSYIDAKIGTYRTNSRSQRGDADYIAPGLEETWPRTIVIDGKSYGRSITVGRRSYDWLPFPGRHAYLETLNSAAFAKRRIAGLFFSLELVEQATEFAGGRGSYTFSGMGFSGSITVRGGFVARVKDKHLVVFKDRVVGRAGGELRYLVHARIAPIVAPPASAIKGRTIAVYPQH